MTPSWCVSQDLVRGGTDSFPTSLQRVVRIVRSPRGLGATCPHTRRPIAELNDEWGGQSLKWPLAIPVLTACASPSPWVGGDLVTGF